MDLTKIKIYTEPEIEQMEGADEESETTDRYILSSGGGEVLTTGPVDLPITSQQSGFMHSNTPRWSEEIYQSIS